MIWSRSSGTNRNIDFRRKYNPRQQKPTQLANHLLEDIEKRWKRSSLSVSAIAHKAKAQITSIIVHPLLSDPLGRPGDSRKRRRRVEGRERRMEEGQKAGRQNGKKWGREEGGRYYKSFLKYAWIELVQYVNQKKSILKVVFNLNCPITLVKFLKEQKNFLKQFWTHYKIAHI